MNDRVQRYFRGHPEMVMFIIGAVLFLAGLGTVVTAQLRSSSTVPDATPTTVAGLELKAQRLGPEPGASLPEYIQLRKSVLARRASQEAKVPSFAVISFDSYRKPADVDRFVKSSKVDVVSVQIRIPLPGFHLENIKLDGRPVSEAVIEATGPKRVAKLREELEELEQIIPTVDDVAYKRQYEMDARSHRDAIRLLGADPATVFALVVKATNATLAKTATTPGVRLVDVGDNETVKPETHDFFGLLPEDTDRATFEAPNR